jgi:hypothetical protein
MDVLEAFLKAFSEESPDVRDNIFEKAVNQRKQIRWLR